MTGEMTSTVPDWLPGVEKHISPGSGPMLDSAAWKLLLHTTEGSTIQGALAALDEHRSWPHLVFDPSTAHLVQCIPFNDAARALKSGGTAGRTNAARVIQIEVVGFAAATPHWSTPLNDNLGNLIARLSRTIPFDPHFRLPFYGQDAGFTVASDRARQRLTFPQWYAYGAICGHQHAPANNHWDPGAINTIAIQAAIDKALNNSPIPPSQEPFTVAQYETIIARLDAQDRILAELEADYLTKGESMRQVILDTHADVEDVASGKRPVHSTPAPSAPRAP